ncbi:MAG: tRNA (guanosine(18)-2'-O)-methyltransferase TrmH [Exilibacterium sp.]
MTPERYTKISQVLSCRQPDLTVITDEVHKGRNLSAIVRTCDAVGVDRIHCVVPKAGFRAYHGTARGSHKWVEVQNYESIEQPILTLQGQGFQVLAAHPCGASKDFREFDYTQPTAVLLGTEKQGVSEAALRLVDGTVTIAMMGMVASFNVSVACAIILAECQRQRQQVGLYNGPRLPADLYRQRLFQWAHPVLTKFCDEHGLAYPPLREDGEVLDAANWHREIRALGYSSPVGSEQ